MIQREKGRRCKRERERERERERDREKEREKEKLERNRKKHLQRVGKDNQYSRPRTPTRPANKGISSDETKRTTQRRLTAAQHAAPLVLHRTRLGGPACILIDQSSRVSVPLGADGMPSRLGDVTLNSLVDASCCCFWLGPLCPRRGPDGAMVSLVVYHFRSALRRIALFFCHLTFLSSPQACPSDIASFPSTGFVFMRLQMAAPHAIGSLVACFVICEPSWMRLGQ